MGLEAAKEAAGQMGVYPDSQLQAVRQRSRHADGKGVGASQAFRGRSRSSTIPW